jgi:hypothetical protein
MMMRNLVLATLLAFAAFSSNANAASDMFGGFVKGTTTVADVEQKLGAPLNTTMQADGALTLVYPVSRLADGTAKPDAAGVTVALHFGTDFVLRDAIVTEAIVVTANRFAAK